MMKIVLLSGALVTLMSSEFEACAQTVPTPPQLTPVVVTATRIESLAADVPASITRIDGD